MTESIHPAAQNGFANAAQLYQSVRPSYPDEITQWLVEHLHLGQQDELLDLGSGTGKFLANLSQISHRVTAVEPIAEMLQQLQARYPQVHSVQASSQQLPFSDNLFDAVFCAQSFHWFANAASLKEIHRLLKPAAKLGLIWNQRDESVDWVKALAECIEPYESDTPRYHRQEWQNVFNNQHLFKTVDVVTFRHVQSGTVEEVVCKRLRSTSFIAAMPQAQQQSLQAQFEHIVFAHTGKRPDEQIDFPYTTYAYFYEKI